MQPYQGETHSLTMIDASSEALTHRVAAIIQSGIFSWVCLSDAV